MERVLDNLRATIISPEFLIISIVLGVYFLYPQLMGAVGEKIKLENELWKYLFSLPFIFTAISIRQSSKIRAPLENSSNKVLYEWEFYNRIIDRVYIGIIYSILSSICVVSVLIFQGEINNKIVGSIFIAGTCVSGIVALTMFFAPQKLRELLEKYAE